MTNFPTGRNSSRYSKIASIDDTIARLSALTNAELPIRRRATEAQIVHLVGTEVGGAYCQLLACIKSVGNARSGADYKDSSL